MSLRQYRLDEAFEAAKRAAHLRRPQREAFEIVHALVSKLDNDIPKLTDSAMEEELRDLGYKSPYPPHFQIQLATGVGKTRLMGCIAHYLFHARQTRNILVVAPRVTILEKLEREASPTSAKYLLIDPALGPRVNLCTRSNIEVYRPSGTLLNLFLLSPQTLTSDGGRFARPDEHRGFSLRDYLSNCGDLVVFADEAHHLRASEEAAWSTALRDLRPKLWLGFTATPEAASEEVLYHYDLADCLRDGLYTKSVKVWVEQKQEGMTDEEWDQSTIEFALRRLSRKQAALRAYRDATPDFPAIEPVLLICAKDTAHADAVGRMLQEKFGLPDEEILITHSERAKSEEDVARLISIDAPGSRIRVVVNVFQLTEGWDVTNVYVIAPLRAMATFAGAVQSMGRGLRLPAGKRTADPDVDSLDMICFGRAALGEIVREATQAFGGSALGGPPPMEVVSLEELGTEKSIADSSVEIKPVVMSVAFSSRRLEKVLETPSLDFHLEASSILEDTGVSGISLEDLQTSTSDDTVSVGFDSLVSSATMRILAKCRCLNPIGDALPVRGLVERLLLGLGASKNGEVMLDPVRLAVFLAAEINKRYAAQAPAYTPTEIRDVVQAGPYSWPVPTGRESFLPCVDPEEWVPAYKNLPFGGWSKCVYEAAAFESYGEYKVASILDNDLDVLWWLRNDPPKLRIPTPSGYFEPDFVVASGTAEQVARLTILEVKGGFLWGGPESPERLKARAAVRWAEMQSSFAKCPRWSVVVVLDEDTRRAASFGDLLKLNAP
jgi:superfamily II DNA or RNA helicase